jgi:hypothetical protein
MQLMSTSCLFFQEISFSDYLDLQTDIRAKLVTYAIFLVFGSLQKLNMPQLHGFVKSLNIQRVILKRIVKIHILIVDCFWMFFVNLESTVFQSTISGHFVPKRKSRVSDIQFTRELILRVGNVHILLVPH